MKIEAGQKIGEFLESSLVSIEDALYTFEWLFPETPPGFTEDAFRAIVKVFMSAMLDKMWALQEAEDMDVEDRLAMVNKCGQDLKAFVKTYTAIDTEILYDNEG